MILRPPRLYDHHHQLEQFQDSQFCSSMRPQQSSQHQRLNQVTETANGIGPQHHNILVPESSTPFRYFPFRSAVYEQGYVNVEFNTANI